MDNNILAVQNLHYSYLDGTRALQNINLNIKRGRITSLLGGNGAGKSTLFMLLNGIIRPTFGQLFYDGKPFEYSKKGLSKLRQKVGIVFQDPDRQLFSANVYQDISYGALNMQLSLEEVEGRVEIMMQRTGVSHLRHKPTHLLSFGEKKRVALAGVLVMNPEILVLDEPTTGLDPRGTIEIMQLLLEIQSDFGITVIIATHDIDLVPVHCHYTHVMHQGKLVLSGTPKDVFAKKEVLFSANLCLPHIASLFDFLQREDGFHFDETALTVDEARLELKKWREKKLLSSPV